VHITGVGAGRKRPHAVISTTRNVPSNNRDARKPEEEALRPAKNFTKYVDYDLSAMTDTKGGFLAVEDDPHSSFDTTIKPGQHQLDQKPKNMTSQEWERLQLIRSLKRQKAGPFEPGISILEEEENRKRCRECRCLEIDWVWDEVFKCRVCNSCKDKYPEKYSLLTKTECKQDYLLTDRKLPLFERAFFVLRPNGLFSSRWSRLHVR
jgi:DNA-repair protein complementing XP-A cells